MDEAYSCGNEECPMRVLLTMDSTAPSIGGSEVYAAKLASALKHLGLSLDLLVGNHAVNALRTDGRKVVARDYDLINVHGTGQQPCAAASTGQPTIVTVHGYNRQRLRHPAVRERARLVAVGHQQANRLESDGFTVSDIITPGVDLHLFRPSPVDRSKFGIPSNAKIVLFVGQLILRKNVETLLRAAHNLLRDSTEIYVMIVGDGPLRGLLLDLADHLGFGERARFIPRTAHESLVSYYRLADLTVIPSLKENFALVSLEALACGSPLIVSREVSDVIHEFPFIATFDPRSEVELATVMRDALQGHARPVDRAELLRFDWPNIARRYLALFQSVS